MRYVVCNDAGEIHTVSDLAGYDGWIVLDKVPDELTGAIDFRNGKVVSLEYIEARRAAYPPIEAQLDMIFHNGIDAWREAIAAIKAQYPKP